jgi:TRAP transporter TAXI family solute receptor
VRKLSTVVNIISLFFLLASTSLIFSHNALAAKKDRHAIEIYSLRMGMAGYVLSFGLSDLINKYSDMLKASCIETKGTPEDIFTLQRHPEKQSYWIGVAAPGSRYQAQHGISPFPEPYNEIRALGLMMRIGAAFATLDSNIKTLSDMVGKTVMINRPVTYSGLVLKLILQEGLGLYDKLKIVYGGMGPAKRALIDGTIDVGWASATAMTKTPDGRWNWVPVPATDELFQTKKSYMISIPKEAIDKAAKDTGFPLTSIRMAGATVGKSSIEPWTGNTFTNAWYVHKDMPDEIVTEIMRVLWENTEKFKSYHPSGATITQENLPTLAEKRRFFHPAAIKFYKDHGVEQVGID